VQFSPGAQEPRDAHLAASASPGDDSAHDRAGVSPTDISPGRASAFGSGFCSLVYQVGWLRDPFRSTTERLPSGNHVAERSPFVLRGLALAPRPPPSYLTPADASAVPDAARPTSPSLAASPDERPPVAKTQLP
jgi:hypothetical protein